MRQGGRERRLLRGMVFGIETARELTEKEESE